MSTIDLASRLWIRDSSLVGFRPKVKFRCPVCRPWWKFWKRAPEMEMTFGNVFRFTLREEPGPEDSFAMDIWTKCPGCHFSTVHGVPLHISEYEEVMKGIVEKATEAGVLKKGEEVEFI